MRPPSYYARVEMTLCILIAIQLRKRSSQRKQKLFNLYKGTLEYRQRKKKIESRRCEKRMRPFCVGKSRKRKH